MDPATSRCQHSAARGPAQARICVPCQLCIHSRSGSWCLPTRNGRGAAAALFAGRGEAPTPPLLRPEASASSPDTVLAPRSIWREGGRSLGSEGGPGHSASGRPQWHVVIQAALRASIDNAVSKRSTCRLKRPRKIWTKSSGSPTIVGARAVRFTVTTVGLNISCPPQGTDITAANAIGATTTLSSHHGHGHQVPHGVWDLVRDGEQGREGNL